MSKTKNLMPVIVLLLSLILSACSGSTPTSVPATTAPATQAVTQAPVATTVATASKVEPIDPKAGTWKTWVLTSGNQFRRPAPPDKAATEAEIKQLKEMVGQRNAAALDTIAFWDTGGPSYRWNEMLVTYALKNNLPTNSAARHLSLLNAGIYDGMVATWDSKFTFNRPRPSEIDSSLSTVIPNPRYPAYPSEYAVAAAIGSAVLSYIFPEDAAFFNKQAEDATKSRLMAGVDYPSDVAAGLELGRSIAALVIERGKGDGFDAKWTGSVATEPGKWTGTNPVLPMAGTWKPWTLSAPNEFRPAPPPAYDSAQMQTEMNELRDFMNKRTPKTNSDAFFWEYAVGGPRNYQYWNEHTSKYILEYKLDANPVRAARAYALQSITLHDSLVSCWDAKYTYWAPRPFMVDKDFKPLFTTPNHPAYPSAHSCASTGMAAVLGYLFPRDAATVKALADTAIESRMWAGIHFRSDVTAGITIGQKVSQKVLDRAKADGSQ